MAKPLPVKRTGAPPLPSATEARIREEGRQEALDDADRKVLSTLITLDRRQQAQGEQLMAIDQRLARMEAKLDVLLGDHRLVDPRAATMLSENNGNGREHP